MTSIPQSRWAQIPHQEEAWQRPTADNGYRDASSGGPLTCETGADCVYQRYLAIGRGPQLEAAGVTCGDELVLRRVLTPGGRSRSFAKADAAVSLATLEEVGRELVDIHGQHQHQSLLRVETHLDFLDGFARLGAARERYREAWQRLDALVGERAALAQREEEKERRLEFLHFQREELARAALEHGEETGCQYHLRRFSLFV